MVSQVCSLPELTVNSVNTPLSQFVLFIYYRYERLYESEECKYSSCSVTCDQC